MARRAADTDRQGAGDRSDFEVFLSYNTDDREAVEEIARLLKRRRIRPWYDQWEIGAGDSWHGRLLEGMEDCANCAVFIGPHGLGPYQSQEMVDAINRRVKEVSREGPRFYVIPVVLPGTPSDLPLPRPLDRYQAVRFETLDDEEALQRFVDAIRRHPPTGPRRTRTAAKAATPYKGLEKFDIGDAPFFFGREVQIQALLNRLRHPEGGRFLAIVGDSGSGKSSLARAGLLAKLKAGGEIEGSEAWPPAVILQPQSEPLRSLALALAPGFQYKDMDVDYHVEKMQHDPAALRHAVDGGLKRTGAPPAAWLVLLVDQFEEVFSPEADAQRPAFVENLCHAASHPESRVIVLLTLRDDFYGRCASYPSLRDLVSNNLLLGRMSDDELRAAIAKPAAERRREVEKDLVETLVEEAADQPPGFLPLLQYALRELWEKTKGSSLTLAAYHEIGGFNGALQRRAEKIYEGFPPAEQAVCQRVFLRLTHPGEGTAPTRLRVPAADLRPAEGDHTAVEHVVETLVTERLFTLSTRAEGFETPTAEVDARAFEPMIEIAHEALIRRWPRLREWIRERQKDSRIHRDLAAAARAWDDNRRERSYLIPSGSRLSEAEEWSQAHRDDLNETERIFLKACVATRDRLKKFFISLFSAIAVLAVVASILAILSLRQARLAFARELAARASTMVDIHPQRALLLALEAFKRARLAEAESVARESLSRLGGVALGAWNESVRAAAFRPEGIVLVTSDEQERTLMSRWSTDGKLQSGPIELSGNAPLHLAAFSPDGRWLLMKPEGKNLILSRVEPWSPQDLPGTEDVAVLAFSPDSQRFVSGGVDAAVQVRDVEAPSQARFTCDGHDKTITFLKFGPDPGQVLIGDRETEYIWTLSDRDGCSPAPSPSPSGLSCELASASPTGELACTPDGRWWVLSTPEEPPRLYERTNGGVGRSIAQLAWHGSAVLGVTADPRNRRLITWEKQGPARLWTLAAEDPAAGPEPLVLNRQSGVGDQPITMVALAPEGHWLAMAGGGHMARLWDLSSERRGQSLGLRCGDSQEIALTAASPDGRWLAGGGAAGSLCLWDLSNRGLSALGTPIGIPPEPRERLALGPERQWLAISGGGKPLRLWKLAATGKYEQVVLPEASRMDTKALMAFNPSTERPWLIAGWPDGKVQGWDLSKLPPRIVPMARHRAMVQAVTFSSNGRWVATVGKDGRAQLRDLENLNDLGISPDEEGVTVVVFSPDSSELVTGSMNTTVKVWTLPEPNAIGLPKPLLEAELRGHVAGVTALAFGHDSHQWLASGSVDRTVRRWDINESNPGATGAVLPGRASILYLAFTPDGNHLVGVDVRNRIQLWRLDVEELVRLACTALGRNLSRQEWKDSTGRDESPPKTCE